MRVFENVNLTKTIQIWPRSKKTPDQEEMDEESSEKANRARPELLCHRERYTLPPCCCCTAAPSRKRTSAGGDPVFTVTPSGIDAVALESPAPKPIRTHEGAKAKHITPEHRTSRYRLIVHKSRSCGYTSVIFNHQGEEAKNDH